MLMILALVALQPILLLAFDSRREELRFRSGAENPPGGLFVCSLTNDSRNSWRLMALPMPGDMRCQQ